MNSLPSQQEAGGELTNLSLDDLNNLANWDGSVDFEGCIPGLTGKPPLTKTNCLFICDQGAALSQFPPVLSNRLLPALKDHLTQFISYNNKLTGLPKGLELLHNLVKLNVHDNRLAQIDHGCEETDEDKAYPQSSDALFLGHCQKLETLLLYSNKLQSLPLKDFKQFTNLRVINVSGNNIVTLPDEIFANCKSLTLVNVAANLLTKLPNSITQLPRLEKLNASDNQISEFPEGMEELQSLRTLVFSHNQLRHVPVLFQLTQLTALNLTRNQIETVPAALPSSLKEVRLAGNKITRISGELLMNLSPSIRHLDISYNELEELPVQIGQLTALEVLYLSENQLTALPRELACLRGSLKELLVEDNERLVFPPAEVVEEGKDAILDFLESAKQ
jgi:Leucine-rich repeat (LRR) protein